MHMLGYVDPGEYLAAAAIREIKEETGVETEFQSIIAFRYVFNILYLISAIRFPSFNTIHEKFNECHFYHFRQSHQMNFGCSDLYFIVCLKPTSSEIKMCTREISKCEWMPLEVRNEKKLNCNSKLNKN